MPIKRIHIFCSKIFFIHEENNMKRDIILSTNIYGLQVASIFIFIPWLLTIVLNYSRLNDVKGTWLEWHYIRQIITAWINLFIIPIGLLLFFIHKWIGILIISIVSIFTIYRIIQGYLNIRKPYIEVSSDSEILNIL